MEMTSRERILAAFEHREADRIPLYDSAWAGTVARWKREGLPENVSWEDYFGFEKIFHITPDVSPRFPIVEIAEDENSITKTTSWGVTLRRFKELDSTPEFLGFTVTDPDSWKKAKERMVPSKDRIPTERLKYYKAAKEAGAWVQGNFWFGFDITHSWFVGTETLLMAMFEEPEWCIDMFNTELDMNIAMFDMILDAGYEIDAIRWPDDMGYKNNTFFSMKMYRELLKPVQKRAVEWAHSRGIKTHLHSCGDITPLVPELVEIGIDCLNPLEIKAGMDPLNLKKQFGDKLAFHGGINAVLFDETESFIAEMERLIPPLMQNGGYLFASDHSIPNNVTLEEMRAITEAAKRIGRF
ncbi:MAG: hypothetical protein IJC25_03150 [Clostridia bacterium]|nr:hypothetical protein [Clostridia bacterium]